MSSDQQTSSMSMGRTDRPDTPIPDSPPPYQGDAHDPNLPPPYQAQDTDQNPPPPYEAHIGSRDPSPPLQSGTPSWSSTSQLVKCIMLGMLLVIALGIAAMVSNYWLYGTIGSEPVNMGLFMTCNKASCVAMSRGYVRMDCIWYLLVMIKCLLGFGGFVVVTLYAYYVFFQHGVDNLANCNMLKPIWRWLMVASVIHLAGVAGFFFIQLNEASCGINESAVLHFGWSFYVSCAVFVLGVFTFVLLKIKYRQENNVSVDYLGL